MATQTNNETKCISCKKKLDDGSAFITELIDKKIINGIICNDCIDK